MKNTPTTRSKWILIACAILFTTLQVHADNKSNPVETSGQIPYDCPNISANIGDPCTTINALDGIIDPECECIPTDNDLCQDFRYYLSDHSPTDGITDIYEVVISGGFAYMEYIATSPIEVHIAFNPIDKMIYAISKHQNSYRALDQYIQAWGSEISLGGDYGEITAAVFNHDGKLLIGSQTNKMIYSVNINTNAVYTYDTYAPVNGGDLTFASDGMLYMATRSGNGLYEVWSDPITDQLLAILPPKVTGMAITDTDQLMISARGNNALVLRNTDGSNPMVSYELLLNGEPYTLRDGDMASGCAEIIPPPVFCDYYAFLANHGNGINGADIYTWDITNTGIANLTPLTNVDFETHIAYNNNQHLLYLVNADGSFIRPYDLTTHTFLGDMEIVGNFHKITAAVYSPADGLLYVGDQTLNQIHSINLFSGIATYYADAPVSGGDLDTMDDGTLYLGTKEENESALYHIIPGSSPAYLGSIPPNITGMARNNDFGGCFIISTAGTDHLTKISPVDASTIRTYPITLNGASFTLSEGDMTSGCFSP